MMLVNGKQVPSNKSSPSLDNEDSFDSFDFSSPVQSNELMHFSNDQSNFTETENSKWLLQTIKSLCDDCSKPDKYNEIKRELNQRGFIQYSNLKKPNKENCIQSNENPEGQLNEQSNFPKTIRSGSPFPQVYSTLGIIAETHYSTTLKIQNLIDKQIYTLKKLTLSADEITSAIHEIQCLAHLKSPQLIRYFSSWIEEIPNSHYLSFYIQTEFFEKQSLQHFLQIRRNNDAPPMQIVHKVFIDLAKALDEIHQAGIVHRDLQPSNLMFRSDYSIVIDGFSISSTVNNNKQKSLIKSNRNLRSSLPVDHNVDSLDAFCINAADTATKVSNRNIGSPIYASPQQLNGRKCFPSDDIYSFGIIMFEILANFENDTKRRIAIRKLRNDGAFPEKFQQEYNEESKLILKMTCHDPSKRPSASQILQTILFQNWKKEQIS